MLWITFSLLAAMLWALVNVIDKYTMTKLVDQPVVPVLVLGGVGLLAALVIYGMHGLTLFSPFNMLLTFLAGLFYVLTMYFYYQAIKREEVSRVIPLYYLAPVFIVFLASEFLNETLSVPQWFGLALLVSGAILISASIPFKFRVNQAVGYILLAAGCYALNQVFTKYVLQYESFWSVFAYVRIGIFICLLPIGYWGIKAAVSTYKKSGCRAYVVMTINQVLNLSGVLAITLALSSGYVTLVNALSSTQPFFVLILTVILSFFFPHILKEKQNRSILMLKGVAITLIVGGAILVSC
ncbi:MAG: EamA family transporter [Gammaproteobacteria bacterium]|nr:EamA family transporter [Gammaproteobacteria bacterium]